MNGSKLIDFGLHAITLAVVATNALTGPFALPAIVCFTVAVVITILGYLDTNERRYAKLEIKALRYPFRFFALMFAYVRY